LKREKKKVKELIRVMVKFSELIISRLKIKMFIFTWKILKFCVWAESNEGLRTVGCYLDASGVALVSRWRAEYGDSLQSYTLPVRRLSL